MSDFLKQAVPLLIFVLVVAAGVWGVRHYLRAKREQDHPFIGGYVGSTEDRDTSSTDTVRPSGPVQREK